MKHFRPRHSDWGYLAILGIALIFFSMGALGAENEGSVPETEPLSTQFTVSVEASNLPVYLARIVSLSADQRKPMGAPMKNQTTTTSFASFDLSHPTKVTVLCADDVNEVKLLPSSRGIKTELSGKSVSFTVDKPGPLTLEVNGNWINSLHLFVNPVETDVPNPNAPQVIYFGPGVHRVQSVKVTSGKTVYLANGAIVYGEFGPGNSTAPIFDLQGSNIVLRGRGVIDGSMCDYHTRSILGVSDSTNIRVEGVVLRDSSGFTLPVRRSRQVTISNVKVFGWRGNSDGMDICNSHDVEISDCFLRTFDDLIVLKTDKSQGDLQNVTVQRCVLWNEFAHALSLGAELREPLANVLFSNCDVIHDKGREWLLRVYNCDSAPVKNVIFDNIRIEEARRLMSLWIGQTGWSREAERGHIDDVVFKNIQSVRPEIDGAWVELTGFDALHAINQVQFQNVRVGNQALKSTDIRENTFVHGVTIAP